MYWKQIKNLPSSTDGHIHPFGILHKSHIIFGVRIDVIDIWSNGRSDDNVTLLALELFDGSDFWHILIQFSYQQIANFFHLQWIRCNDANVCMLEFQTIDETFHGVEHLRWSDSERSHGSKVNLEIDIENYRVHFSRITPWWRFRHLFLTSANSTKEDAVILVSFARRCTWHP